MNSGFFNFDTRKFKRKIIPKTIEILSITRKTNIAIIHIITEYKNDKSDWPKSLTNRDKIWCLENTEESKIINDIEPKENEIKIIKKRFSGFYNTELQPKLIELKIDTIFIAGYSADVCVRLTTMDAFNEGYKIYWLSDCIDSAFEKYSDSLKYIKRLTNLTVLNNNEYYKLLNDQKIL